MSKIQSPALLLLRVTTANLFYILPSFVTINFQICNCKLKKKSIMTHTLISCLKCHYIMNVIHVNVIFYNIYSTMLFKHFFKMFILETEKVIECEWSRSRERGRCRI